MARELNTPSPYGKEFYEQQKAGSYSSAQAIIPLLLELIEVQSAVDVGCGTGTWLKALQNKGISEVQGVDGDYVDRQLLQIPSEKFRAIDICHPFCLDRRFDLAISLEVAEHLPPENAAQFIRSLTALSPVIVFSAAIPFQGGTNHLNERWPDYWAGLFYRNGYVPIDCIRPQIWNDPRVEWWYAQNILIYANEEGIAGNPGLAKHREQATSAPLSLIHPKKYLSIANVPAPGVRDSLALLRVAAKKSVLKRFISAKQLDSSSTS